MKEQLLEERDNTLRRREKKRATIAEALSYHRREKRA
jgi:hypothetical protein